ncbi:phage major capsid protein [Umezawaea tangerina]|uniref:HK97 family phage major capsid protein n=1 Tax=Umezawaea tangerina TaxID=84725 RepID=A0A2T0SPK8_9PSEU|nr:phage major capsid protein [Umezawaea tangerina]PRY35349.1 HK97 family phage major capsid protein [Umezawaea tangerina]
MLTKTLLPGQRARLAALGVDARRVGRVSMVTQLIAPKNVPVPKNSDELAEMVFDTAKMAPVMKDPATLGGWIKAYGDAQQGPGTVMNREVKEQIQATVAETLREQGLDPTPRNINRLNLDPDAPQARRAKGYNPKAPGRKLDKQYQNWSDYMSTIWAGNQSMEALQARSDITKVMNSFGSTVPSDGGFLIPEALRAELLRVSLETAVVRPLARIIPMDSLTVPFPTIDATSNATSVHGGIVGYWTEEGGALTDSAPKFGRVTLTAKKLTVYSEVPNELFQDSLISLEAFMNEAYPEAISWFEDTAFISGSGVYEPLGFLNAPAAVTVPKESGQGAATVLWENIVKAYSRMLPGSLGRAVWICNIDVFPELATMALSVGTGGSAVWIGNGDGAGAPPVTILGRPVIFTEKVNALGAEGDINFVDLGYYLVGDRMAMQAETSTHSAFSTDKTAMRVIERVDGRPWIQSAITPQNSSKKLSPFVKVAVRA